MIGYESMVLRNSFTVKSAKRIFYVNCKCVWKAYLSYYLLKNYGWLFLLDCNYSTD